MGILIKNGEIPLAHGLQSEFFLEEWVNIEQWQVIVLDFDNLIFWCGVDNGSNLCTIVFKLFGLLDNIWKACQNELIYVFLSTIDDLF